ncbi:S-layer homology domain-containing protein [Paenibacillus alkalitolerans]|uniref:S-layer homology domain-containing protein n=1 Tax=Paenibacillus alkalitolerans TaxID=2799335 RepID=UPI0018F4F00A|nr:S-layer homology domain-containing protein [Paenibacillus alkalitolerans]
MKRFGWLLLLCTLIVPSPSFAAPAEYSGGVSDEYRYEEYVFITGEPIKFEGKMTRNERTSKDKTTISYNFSLKSTNPGRPGTLDRRVTYVTQATARPDKGQTTTVTTVTDNYQETIEISGQKFTLDDYRFSKSDVVDVRPAADYYSGNIVGRKIFLLNKGKANEKEIVVTISGGDVGYKNFWGNTETQIIDYEYQSDTWTGTVRAQTSDTKTKKLVYQGNGAAYSSFDGGYVRVTEAEQTATYSYNLPTVTSNGYVDTQRNIGESKLILQSVPSVERLIVPKFRDTVGHWAEEAIEKLYSLDIFEENTQFFVPDVPMSRYDFTVAVMKAADVRLDNPKSKKAAAEAAKKPSMFKDLKTSDSNYQYIYSANEKDIVKGMTADLFKPDDPLTKAQAITIMLRALGFEHRAPAPEYRTEFADDESIPYWAKDKIYVAREIGLMMGDESNRARAGKVLSRAETAMLLERFLEFLEKDLQIDYRENIILY